MTHDALLRQMSACILDASVASPVLFVAIDGVDGAGKTTLADALASRLEPMTTARVIRASVDGFHQPRALRYARGRHAPDGFFRDSYDYGLLFELLLDPLRAGTPYRVRGFDHVTDERVRCDAVCTPERVVLIFDGIFLHRDELHDVWDLSFFLDVDFEQSLQRCVARGDQASLKVEHAANRRYVHGQRLYFEACDPRSRATLVIDYNDMRNPRIAQTSSYRLDELSVLCEQWGAPPRLIRHGELVAGVARELGELCDGVDVDRLVRAAFMHDIGKLVHPEELDQPGRKHELEGYRWLLSQGFEPGFARVCLTHARWQEMPCDMAELLVTLADKLWKGARLPRLEWVIMQAVAWHRGADVWDVFANLDARFESIADGAIERLRTSR